MTKLILSFAATFSLQPLSIIFFSIIFVNYHSDCSRAYADLSSWLFCFYLCEFFPIFTWKRLPLVFLGFFILSIIALVFDWPYAFTYGSSIDTIWQYIDLSLMSGFMFIIPTVLTLLARKMKSIILSKSKLLSGNKAQAR